MVTKAISSGTVFKALIDLGRKTGTTAGTKLNAVEVKAALDVFGWNDGKVTKTEVIAARREFSALQQAGKLTTDGAQAFNEWFTATGPGEPGGFAYQRSASVFDNLEGFFRFGPNSEKGATFTKAEASTLLSLLGSAPSPARVADVTELLARVKGSGKSKDAQAVLSQWLKAHPLPRPPQPLAGVLDGAVKDMLWPSETDRTLYPVDLGKAPGSTQSVANAARKALGEPDSAKIEVRDFDDTFAQLAEVNDPNDPGEVARAGQWAALRDTLKTNLTELHVVRVGEIDIDLYAVGKDQNGRWVGVMSGVVET